MVLKKAAHKVQSSIATFIFAQRELSVIEKDYPRERLVSLCRHTVARTDKEYAQMFGQLRLYSFPNHFEILSRSLMEHLGSLDTQK